MPDKRKLSFGARVRQLREERGWSQAELAANLPDVKQQSVDQLERGKVGRPRFLPELAEVLGTSVHWLLTGDGERRPLASSPDAGIDARLLSDVMMAVEAALADGKASLSQEERAKLTAALYELMLREERRDRHSMEQAAQNIIRYEQFRKTRS